MYVNNYVYLFFFFQAEDGIRDTSVTGVQTCALPICERRDICRRKQIRATGQQLSQLDERRPHRLEVRRQLFRFRGRLTTDRVVLNVAIPSRLGYDVRAAVLDQQNGDVLITLDMREFQGVAHDYVPT